MHITWNFFEMKPKNQENEGLFSLNMWSGSIAQ